MRISSGRVRRGSDPSTVIFFDRKPGADTPWTKTVWVYDLNRCYRHVTSLAIQKRYREGDTSRVALIGSYFPLRASRARIGPAPLNPSHTD